MPRVLAVTTCTITPPAGIAQRIKDLRLLLATGACLATSVSPLTVVPDVSILEKISMYAAWDQLDDDGKKGVDRANDAFGGLVDWNWLLRRVMEHDGSSLTFYAELGLAKAKAPV